MPLTRAEAIAILDEWRDLDNAIRNVGCSLPHQIGERVKTLEAEARSFGDELMRLATESIK